MSRKKKKIKQGAPETTIVVPKETRDYWYKNYDVGDFTKMKEALSLSRPSIRRAWNPPYRASEMNMNKITAFYEEREREGQLRSERIRLAKLGEGKA